jgi:hypothetical protein
MRLWKNAPSILCLTLLAGCARAPGALTVRSASVDAGVLSAHVDWQPDANVLAALDHGIALDFLVQVRAEGDARFGVLRHTLASSERHVELRYYPLSRQYQWYDLDRGETRSYAARALLLAALEDLRLPLAGFDASGAHRFTLAIALDRSTLPGALRVPALLNPQWHISSGEYAWPAPAG